MRDLVPILKALSDETRFRLLELLLAKNLCGKALAGSLGVSEAAVSQHLKVLKEAGLVAGEKRGYWMHYSVQQESLNQVIYELDRLARQSAAPTEKCTRLHSATKGYEEKEVKAMCQCCCERSEKLKGKPEECTPQQIKECHGDVKGHPCQGEKKEAK